MLGCRLVASYRGCWLRTKLRREQIRGSDAWTCDRGSRLTLRGRDLGVRVTSAGDGWLRLPFGLTWNWKMAVRLRWLMHR